jgi:hypothetical protein
LPGPAWRSAPASPDELKRSSERAREVLEEAWQRLPKKQTTKVLDAIKGLILRNLDIDLEDLSQSLKRLCSFIDSRKKNEGGNPGHEYWNELMGKVARIYEEATGTKATVTENQYAEGDRYSGQFVRVATIIDRATAAMIRIKPRHNTALGPALRRLVEPRKPSRDSRTK